MPAEPKAGGTSDLELLYEDNHLLVLSKPAGMLSQADLGGDLDALTAARQLIKTRDRKPGNVYLGLVHRLDRPVSGVLVLAKTSKAAGRLARQFRDREVRKVYHAVVAGAVEPPEGALEHNLEKDRATRVTRAVPPPRGKPARLRYRTLAARADLTHLEVELITGLPHQIRAQLAVIGHPILGDRKYGSTVALPGGPGRIALFARSVTLAHPVRGEPLTFTAAAPPHWPW